MATTDTRAALEKIERAFEMVSALCNGTRRWTMSIPADERRDPDLVICDALVAARDLLAAPPAPVEGEAYDYLSRLLTTHAPGCEPLPDLLGVCSQIDNLLARPAEGSAEREDFFAGDPPPERGIPYPVDLSKLPPPAAGSAEREGESPEALAELISRLTDASWMRHPDEAEDMMVLRALCGEARVALEDYAALRGQGEG